MGSNGFGMLNKACTTYVVDKDCTQKAECLWTGTSCSAVKDVTECESGYTKLLASSNKCSPQSLLCQAQASADMCATRSFCKWNGTICTAGSSSSCAVGFYEPEPGQGCVAKPCSKTTSTACINETGCAWSLEKSKCADSSKCAAPYTLENGICKPPPCAGKAADACMTARDTCVWSEADNTCQTIAQCTNPRIIRDQICVTPCTGNTIMSCTADSICAWKRDSKSCITKTSCETPSFISTEQGSSYCNPPVCLNKTQADCTNNATSSACAWFDTSTGGMCDMKTKCTPPNVVRNGECLPQCVGLTNQTACLADSPVCVWDKRTAAGTGMCTTVSNCTAGNALDTNKRLCVNTCSFDTQSSCTNPNTCKWWKNASTNTSQCSTSCPSFYSTTGNTCVPACDMLSVGQAVYNTPQVCNGSVKSTINAGAPQFTGKCAWTPTSTGGSCKYNVITGAAGSASASGCPTGSFPNADGVCTACSSATSQTACSNIANCVFTPSPPTTAIISTPKTATGCPLGTTFKSPVYPATSGTCESVITTPSTTGTCGKSCPAGTVVSGNTCTINQNTTVVSMIIGNGNFPGQSGSKGRGSLPVGTGEQFYTEGPFSIAVSSTRIVSSTLVPNSNGLPIKGRLITSQDKKMLILFNDTPKVIRDGTSRNMAMNQGYMDEATQQNAHPNLYINAAEYVSVTAEGVSPSTIKVTNNVWPNKIPFTNALNVVDTYYLFPKTNKVAMFHTMPFTTIYEAMQYCSATPSSLGVAIERQTGVAMAVSAVAMTDFNTDTLRYNPSHFYVKNSNTLPANNVSDPRSIRDIWGSCLAAPSASLKVWFQGYDSVKFSHNFRTGCGGAYDANDGTWWYKSHVGACGMNDALSDSSGKWCWFSFIIPPGDNVSITNTNGGGNWYCANS